MNTISTKPKIAFFGTPEFSVWVLDALYERRIIPDLIICAPDAPKGRKLVMSPPDTKVWAEKYHIPVIQPAEIKSAEFAQTLAGLCPDRNNSKRWDLFIVAAYGKIMPENILYTPVYKTINVHPSMLPLLRGSSPLQSSILQDMSDTGVTIMLLDKGMDHGPILIQKKSEFTSWPIDTNTLGMQLAKEGGSLIADIMDSLIDKTLQPVDQDHTVATYTNKIKKEDGLIDLTSDDYTNFLKFNAYKGWPGSFFFIEKDGKKIRVSITDAVYENDIFIPKTIILEGKKEISWDEFNREYC